MSKVKSPRAVFVVSPQLKTYGGMNLSQGEVFELQGLRNDDKLLKYSYIKPFAVGDETIDCGTCGRQFAHSSGLNSHNRYEHTPGQRDPNRVLTPAEHNQKAPALSEIIPPMRGEFRGSLPGSVGLADPAEA